MILEDLELALVTCIGVVGPRTTSDGLAQDLEPVLLTLLRWLLLGNWVVVI